MIISGNSFIKVCILPTRNFSFANNLDSLLSSNSVKLAEGNVLFAKIKRVSELHCADNCDCSQTSRVEEIQNKVCLQTLSTLRICSCVPSSLAATRRHHVDQNLKPRVSTHVVAQTVLQRLDLLVLVLLADLEFLLQLLLGLLAERLVLLGDLLRRLLTPRLVLLHQVQLRHLCGLSRVKYTGHHMHTTRHKLSLREVRVTD